MSTTMLGFRWDEPVKEVILIYRRHLVASYFSKDEGIQIKGKLPRCSHPIANYSGGVFWPGCRRSNRWARPWNRPSWRCKRLRLPILHTRTPPRDCLRTCTRIVSLRRSFFISSRCRARHRLGEATSQSPRDYAKRRRGVFFFRGIGFN